jgi:hypothetical protein
MYCSAYVDTVSGLSENDLIPIIGLDGLLFTSTTGAKFVLIQRVFSSFQIILAAL